MSNKAIWGIVSLMAVSLIGIIGLQSFWTGKALRVAEEQFDSNVFLALANVRDALEMDDNENIINEAFTKTSEMGGDTAAAFSDDQSSHPPNCGCERCKAQRIERSMRYQISMRTKGNKRLPLEERISNTRLDTLLKSNLAGQGLLGMKYDYGVYSLAKKGVVIKNGHYLIGEDISGQRLGGSVPIFANQSTSPLDDPTNCYYKTELFPNDYQTQGYLMVDFHNRTGFVWRNVQWTFLSGLLFTGIILFCFIYTVRVILFQKKVSTIKNDFINNMTHEFKTPIATISLAADSITSPMIMGHKDKIERFANIIKQENRRMNSQVEKVLQMALVDKDTFQLKVTDVNLHDIIQTAVANINLQVEKKNGQASTRLHAERPIVQGDLTHVSNVINNLLDNANKYTPESPNIIVGTRNLPGGVEISVKDNGIGMSKEARKHIFDKFYRVHTGNLHDVKGFGLGLSYVKAIVTAHKGHIDVKSELGKGSEFIVFFPH
jgi:two-component system phosphate regulon sensor histidine kinase PhoR